MSATTAILAGRRAAENLMLDTCTIRAAGPVTTDDLTGTTSSTSAVTYSGKCKIQQATAMGQRVDAGEGSTVLLRLEIHLPVVGSENVARGQVVTVDSSVNDQSLVGRTFRIHDEAYKSFATARRLGVEEVT